jgi:hypothetical protein
MFHLSWAAQRSIVAVLSGFGLFELASAVGVKFLDKLEGCVDFRAAASTLTAVWIVCTFALARTRKSAAAPEHGSVREVVDTLRSTLSAWLIHCRGMRLGRKDLQVRHRAPGRGWVGGRGRREGVVRDRADGKAERLGGGPGDPRSSPACVP